ncbi:phosphate ABC transporter substrate-binding protein [Megasphaera stantonii]|uniref:Phosphate ABC transporter substrate-binding protein n=1 Tax=Megasphaera stantonii TaxID=2144175 RepID=A0A346B0S2_9FIRM|nr:phosphate ABC transporter substrate-binding protein [Megasphaera stantonii]AXL21715.1 phosphate ABC transporter substrate-binding protein [Megasphaera stantonii]
MIRKLLPLFCCALLIFSLSGCGGTEKTLSGHIQVVGSTSMEPLCSLVSESYMEKEQGISVSNEYVGSTAGIEALLAGNADIGTSSRNLTQQEKNQGIVENIVAKDGIDIIINRNVTGVTALTSEQIRSLFTGEITNWKDLGGPDMPVIVIGQEAGSGTRAPFEEMLKLEGICRYSNELSGSGPVLARVAETNGAVGYCSMALADNSVTHIIVDGIAPTKENIQNGSYPLSKAMVMATKGAIANQSPEVQSFFDFIYSAEGQALIQKVNLIPMPKN